MGELASAESRVTAVDSFSGLHERHLIDGARRMVIVGLDRDGRITLWNQGARAVFGWAREDVAGHGLERLYQPDDRAADRLAQLFTDAAASADGALYEGWHVAKDGRLIWVFGEIAPVREHGELTGFVLMMQDCTAQRETELTLREECRALEIINRAGIALSVEHDLHKLVQTVTDCGVELTRAQFGAFFYTAVDDAGQLYTLYAISGAPLEAFSKFPHPRKTAVFAPTFDGEILRSDDITQDPRYGKTAPHHGMPKGHLPVRSYLAVPVASRHGKVLGTLFFGHGDPGVFSDRSEQSLLALAAEAAIAVENVYLAQAAQRELDSRLAADEALRQLNLSLEQQVMDRTEKLRQNEEALRQAQKMEAIGQLTGGVAHDFNNLLQVIMGNLEIIERGLSDGSPRLRQAAAQAMSGADRAALMTQRLLAFSRKQPLAPKPINVNEEIVGFANFAHRTLGENISVRTMLDAGVWSVEADPNALQAALINLAVNARDAMPEGGPLTISTGNRHVERDEADRISDGAPGPYVVIKVTDTGAGMSEEELARAFEPFFTTKPVGKGTGLGLSQVYGFAKQSGGHVHITSAVGQGTSVEMFLPPTSLVAGDGDAAPTAPAEQSRESATILVVEDDSDVRLLSVQILRDLGFNVISARDAASAMKEDDCGSRIDLLFSDVVLPGNIDGVELSRAIVALRPDIKVLFTTGYGRQAIFRDGRLDPDINLITKPFSAQALSEKIREVLNQDGRGLAVPRSVQ